MGKIISMNETLYTLYHRRSLRNFSDKPIAPEVRDQIIDAAIQAPSAGAMMLYSIIEVTDLSRKEALSLRCDNQPFILRAPLVLLFLADYQRWIDYYAFCDAESICEQFGRTPRLPAENDLLLSCMDTLIAAQNTVIAAESLGIGSCYIGDILEHYEENCEMFNLPRYVAPVALVCYGYPMEDQMNRAKPERIDKSFIVHENEYHRASPEKLQNMVPDSWRCIHPSANPMTMLNHGQYNYIRKFTAPFSLEMRRSVRKMLKNWQDDHD